MLAALVRMGAGGKVAGPCAFAAMAKTVTALEAGAAFKSPAPGAIGQSGMARATHMRETGVTRAGETRMARETGMGRAAGCHTPAMCPTAAATEAAAMAGPAAATATPATMAAASAAAPAAAAMASATAAASAAVATTATASSSAAVAAATTSAATAASSVACVGQSGGRDQKQSRDEKNQMPAHGVTSWLTGLRRWYASSARPAMARRGPILSMFVGQPSPFMAGWSRSTLLARLKVEGRAVMRDPASERNEHGVRRSRTWFLAHALMLLLAPAIATAQEMPVQTADPALRGLMPSDFPHLLQLAPHVYAYEDLRPSEPGKFKTTVDMIVVTSGGVLVADGQGNLAATQKLVAQIKKLTPLPVKYVVVCSEHEDHTGGNAAFKAAFPDAVFVASPVSQKALAASATPPTEAVADKRTIRLGDTDIEILNLGRAHTGGDLSVYVPGASVLFLSEIYDHRLFPNLARGYPSEWLSTIGANQAIGAKWVFGGHGFVDDPATMKRELSAFADEIAYVIAEGRRLHDAGVACRSLADCDAVKRANWGPYESWSERVTQAPGALWRVYQETDGKLAKQK